MRKSVRFSNYVDIENISMNPSILDLEDSHRYSLTIPFRESQSLGHAIVIMKNPSNAGKLDETGQRVSDDTIYKILDYIRKLEETKICKVTIVNLFSIVSGTPANVKEYIGTQDELLHRRQNNIVLQEILSGFDPSKDIIIAGWGDYKPLLESKYKKRIREVINLIGDKPIYRIGPMVNNNKYPGHGKNWYDYEPILPFPDYTVVR